MAGDRFSHLSGVWQKAEPFAGGGAYILKQPIPQFTLLSLLFTWALTSQLAYSIFLLKLERHSLAGAVRAVELSDYNTRLYSIDPAYASSGLKVGDDLLLLNGRPMNSTEAWARFWNNAKPGEVATLTVKRNGEQLTIPLTLKLYRSSFIDWPMLIMTVFILPLSCLLIGFYIAFARPTDPLAWITMAMLVSLGPIASSNTPSLMSSPWREMVFVYHPLLDDTWPIWLLLFALYFPIPFEFIKHRPWIGWLLAVPSAIWVSLAIYGNFQKIQNLREIAWIGKFFQATLNFHVIWFTVCVFLFFALLGWKIRIAKQADAKRRLRVMMWGASAAFTPSLVVVFGELHLLPALPDWLAAACLSLLMVFPATMAYVIVVQRAMDVRMVIRSGVQYAFASTGIRVLQTAIIVLAITVAVRLSQGAQPLLGDAIVIVVGVISVIYIRRGGEQIREWIDKRFFREAYKAEVILTDLGNSVAGIRDVKVLLETVTKRISESLHVPSIAVFLERNGAFRPAYASEGVPALDSVEFGREATVVGFLQRQQAPSKVFFGDPQNWIHGTPEWEQETLRRLDTQLLLPVSLKSRLLGIISLGGKRSEEPYSRKDLQLLSAVASQTGLALENAELTESVRREIAQRERLDRELEIAREVQQRLFPQNLPHVEGLDVAGYCRPAQGVGGDYYDFIHLSDGSLGIAVGDVSGKGIGAALMMASLQASLRGQTIKPCETLAEMIQHINKLVYEASADNKYATFFYAQYDARTHMMRYVNAGHNPPMICRQRDANQEFIRLEEGGTVVGLFPWFPFQEATVQLMAGDVVVAFTDGISEAMNNRDEEYGEERLMETLCHLQGRTSSEMITQILAAVDGFTAGAKQHDDMTLVVVRVQ